MIKSGFTLIEIMVAIAIIVTISGFALARIQVDDTKALALETTKLSDSIEYMRSLSSSTNARECPAFTGADASKIPKLESVSMNITGAATYSVLTKCDSENNGKYLYSRKLQSGNTFTPSSIGQVVSFLRLNTVNAFPQDGYIEEVKILSASKKDCSCIKILATGLPLASVSCDIGKIECSY